MTLRCNMRADHEASERASRSEQTKMEMIVRMMSFELQNGTQIRIEQEWKIVTRISIWYVLEMFHNGHITDSHLISYLQFYRCFTYSSQWGHSDNLLLEFHSKYSDEAFLLNCEIKQICKQIMKPWYRFYKNNNNQRNLLRTRNTYHDNNIVHIQSSTRNKKVRLNEQKLWVAQRSN